MLYIFDLDGTLIEGFLKEEPCDGCDGGGKVMYGGVIDDCDVCRGRGHKLVNVDYDTITWLPGRAEFVNSLRKAGHYVAIATNQTGVSFGYQTEEQVRAKLQRVADELDRVAVYTVFDYHDTVNRKPGPGMLQRAMADHAVPPWRTIMVGDMATDRTAAEAAGCAFAWANSFFG